MTVAQLRQLLDDLPDRLDDHEVVFTNETEPIQQYDRVIPVVEVVLLTDTVSNRASINSFHPGVTTEFVAIKGVIDDERAHNNPHVIPIRAAHRREHLLPQWMVGE